MLLVDSNVFIYARGRHKRSKPCRDFLARAADHPEWAVPFLVLLEVTHYFADNGEYARLISGAFPTVETLVADFHWGMDNSGSHVDLNDHVLLATANRLGASGVISYDRIFDRQQHFPDVRRLDPEALA